jgi:flagellar motor switch protein FliN/FliY
MTTAMWGVRGFQESPAVGVKFNRVSQVNEVNVELSVVLGRSVLPMQQLLRMGRGAVIPLDAQVNDEVWILANNHPVARGEIQINEERITISVTRAASVYDFMAGGGQ